MTSLFERLGAHILAEMFEVAAHGLALVDESGRYLHANARATDMLARSYDSMLNATMFSHVAGDERAGVRGWFEASLAGEVRTCDITLVRPDGRSCEVSAFLVPVLLDESQAGLLALHDVTETRRAEREARTLAQLAASLNLTRSLYAIAERIASWVVGTTEAAASAVYVTGVRPGTGRLVGAVGFTADGPPELDQSDEELTRHLFGGPEVATIDLTAAAPSDLTASRLADAPAGGRATYALGVPLIYRSNRVGTLLVMFVSEAAPDEHDIAFIRAVADQSVLAIENARLFSMAQDKAALEERQRLARELHDSVSQALYGIALGARSARSQLHSNPQRVAERLDYVLKLAEAAITEMRALIFELRPETLANDGLVAALSKQAAALGARHHLEVKTSFAVEPDVDIAAKEALYRIAQEALHNVVKHAAARRVDLALEVHDGKLVLRVADDGAGFEPRGHFPGHYGLASMRERAELLGGALSIASSPGEGTRLRAAIPLAATGDR